MLMFETPCGCARPVYTYHCDPDGYGYATCLRCCRTLDEVEVAVWEAHCDSRDQIEAEFYTYGRAELLARDGY